MLNTPDVGKNMNKNYGNFIPKNHRLQEYFRTPWKDMGSAAWLNTNFQV
jgi:hypothetical protein